MLKDTPKEKIFAVTEWMQIAGELGYRFEQKSSVHGRLKMEAEEDTDLL